MKKLSIIGAVLLLTATSVYANVLDTIGVAFGLVDFHRFYIQYANFIDFILLVIFFGTLARQMLEQRLGKKASVAIGIILGLSSAIFLANMGLTLASFGGVGMGVFLIILGVLLYKLVSGLFAGSPPTVAGRVAAGFLAFVVIYFLFKGAVPEFFNWLENTAYQLVEWLDALAIFGVVYLIFWGGAQLFGLIPQGAKDSVGNAVGQYYKDKNKSGDKDDPNKRPNKNDLAARKQFKEFGDAFRKEDSTLTLHIRAGLDSHGLNVLRQNFLDAFVKIEHSYNQYMRGQLGYLSEYSLETKRAAYDAHVWFLTAKVNLLHLLIIIIRNTTLCIGDVVTWFKTIVPNKLLYYSRQDDAVLRHSKYIAQFANMPIPKVDELVRDHDLHLRTLNNLIDGLGRGNTNTNQGPTPGEIDSVIEQYQVLITNQYKTLVSAIPNKNSISEIYTGLFLQQNGLPIPIEKQINSGLLQLKNLSNLSTQQKTRITRLIGLFGGRRKQQYEHMRTKIQTPNFPGSNQEKSVLLQYLSTNNDFTRLQAGATPPVAQNFQEAEAICSQIIALLQQNQPTPPSPQPAQDIDQLLNEYETLIQNLTNSPPTNLVDLNTKASIIDNKKDLLQDRITSMTQQQRQRFNNLSTQAINAIATATNTLSGAPAGGTI